MCTSVSAGSNVFSNCYYQSTTHIVSVANPGRVIGVYYRDKA
jgi:hypothetical protein